MPAQYLKDQSECHDMRLLQYLSARDPDLLWEESKRVKDQFNVCGIPAMACLLETLPPAKGEILHYERWNEEPTQSAVSYAAMVYTSSS
jgi:predicted class III extradiol MEMO1 family dioxygenase